MKEVIKSVYRCLTNDSGDIYDWHKTIKFVRENTDCNGKFFCWHEWRQFEVVPQNMFNFNSVYICSRCVKCKKISMRRTRDVIPVESMLDKKSWTCIV